MTTPKNKLRAAIGALQHLDAPRSTGKGYEPVAKWTGMIAGIALLAFGCPAFADVLIGQASIIDSDTLEIHGNRIRLWGVDAPETTQLCRGEDSEPYRCGAQAANELDAFIARRLVNCNPISLDRYGRAVATCTVGAADLGEWLVRKASPWTGRNTQMGSTAQFNAMLSKLGAECGRAATWSRGDTGSVFVLAGARPIARMTRMLILESEPLGRPMDHKGLRALLIVQGFITAAAGFVLVIAPSPIPNVVGIYLALAF